MDLNTARTEAAEFLSAKTGRDVHFGKLTVGEWEAAKGPHTLVEEDHILDPDTESDYSAVLFADAAYGGIVLVTPSGCYHDNYEIIEDRGHQAKNLISMTCLYAHTESVHGYGTKPWRLYQLTLQKTGKVA